jgi:hypothetical protein
MIALEDFMTVKEFAQERGWTVEWVRYCLREGKLRGLKVGHVWLVSHPQEEASEEHEDVRPSA